MSETKHNNYESKNQSGEMRPESEGERQTKVIPISNEGVSEITFIEVNGEKWIKEKQLDSYRTALKKKIEERMSKATLNLSRYSELNLVIKLIDQTTIEK